MPVPILGELFVGARSTNATPLSAVGLMGPSRSGGRALLDTLNPWCIWFPCLVGEIKVMLPLPSPSVLRLIFALRGTRKSLPSSTRGLPCTTVNSCWQG